LKAEVEVEAKAEVKVKEFRMTEVNRALLARAVAELGVTVPVMRVDVSGAGLKLWLYGGHGQPLTWMPKAEAKVEAEAKAEVEAEAKAKPSARARSTRKKAVGR